MGGGGGVHLLLQSDARETRGGCILMKEIKALLSLQIHLKVQVCKICQQKLNMK